MILKNSLYAALLVSTACAAADPLTTVDPIPWIEIILAAAVIAAIGIAAYFVVKNNATPSSGETLLAQAHADLAQVASNITAAMNRVTSVLEAMVVKAIPVQGLAPAKVTPNATVAGVVVPPAPGAITLAEAKSVFDAALAKYTRAPNASTLAELTVAQNIMERLQK